jgi:hypothetical protein
MLFADLVAVFYNYFPDLRGTHGLAIVTNCVTIAAGFDGDNCSE